MHINRSLHSFRHVYRRSLYDKINMVIFIPIPKNASTSMEHFLIKKIEEKPIDPDFSTIKESLIKYRLHNVCKNPFKAYMAYRKSTKFTIIRDPVERFISARDMLFSHPEWRTTMERKIGVTLNKDNCTDMILNYLASARVADAHFRPQSYFISGINVDCTIKLGRDSIVNKLSKSGLEFWIDGFADQKLNKGKKSETPLTGVQTDFLTKYYEDDFRLFNNT